MQHPEPRLSSRQQPAVLSLFSHPPVTSKRPSALSRRHQVIPVELPELRETFAFVSEFFADFRATASLLPSSPDLAREMVRPAISIGARTVVEFGPGTGPMTTQLLNSLPSDGCIFSFEINPKFVEYLAEHFPDPRLRVVEMGAQHAAEVLAEAGFHHADAVISSLPLSFFPPEMRDAVLRAASVVLRPGGVFTQFQYASGLDCSGRFPRPYDLRPVLGKHFPRISRRLVWRNFPPSWVYTCRMPGGDRPSRRTD